MKDVTRYFIRFQAKVAPSFGDVSDKCEVSLLGSTDAEARNEFDLFCYRHPIEFEGRIITSSLRLIKEQTLAER